MADLYKKLLDYESRDVYPFHMPGHKRQFGKGSRIPYELDITEIEGFDNLNAPEPGEVLWQMGEDARKFYRTLATFPLVNGSTSGLMAAITACTDLQDDIIIGRNCHKSVYRTAELLGLNVHYLYPDYISEYGLFSNLEESHLREVLEENPDSRCVVVTSPTYEGVILDIGLIARVVHEYGKVLIVDEAHGAHLPFLSSVQNTGESSWGRERSALYQGADIVIQSIHKTLPSLTQTALLHVTVEAQNRSRLDLERIASCVHMYQSTSPSYLLMASIDECLNQCRAMAAEGTFQEYESRLREEREQYRNLKHLHLLEGQEIGAPGYDIGKLVFVTAGTSITGVQLMQQLREQFQLECEMPSGEYVIAMTSVCDSADGLSRLREAIFAIDDKISSVCKVVPRIPVHNKKEKKKLTLRLVTEEEVQQTPMEEREQVAQGIGGMGILPQIELSLREAAMRKGMWMDIKRLQFQLENDYVSSSTIPLTKVYQPFVSGAYVLCYPPGIPLLAPGERVTKEIIEEIQRALAQNLPVLGVKNGAIRILL